MAPEIPSPLLMANASKNFRFVFGALPLGKASKKADILGSHFISFLKNAFLMPLTPLLNHYLTVL